MEFIPMIILARKKSKIYHGTNLPVTLWFYCDGKKEEIIYMQNNYHKYTTGNDLVPIRLDKKNPELLEEIKLNIEEKDFRKVQKFIKNNYYTLMAWAKEEWLNYSLMEYTYINRFKPTVIDGFFVEHLSHKRIPELPVDLYFYCNGINYDDERDLYSCLMVNNYESKGKFEDCVTVSIEKENPKLLYDVALQISEEDFRKVQEFIKKHFDFLDHYIKDKKTSFDLHKMMDK